MVWIRNRNTTRTLCASLVLGLAGGTAMTQPAVAQEVEPMKLSFTGGVDYNTHFISYGFDVWAGGTSWNSGTLNPYFELEADFDLFTFVFGTWYDINNNAPSDIGGDLQEVDVYYGISFDIDAFTIGITYQDWYYGGGTERVLDLSLGYDDSELWGGEFALNPYILAHKRLSATNITPATDSGNTGDSNSWVIVLGIEPSFVILDSEDYPLELAIPVSAGFFLDKGFHPGLDKNGSGLPDDETDSGFGFFSVGAMLSMPLTMVPAEYGAWTLSGGVTYYYVDDDVIGNEDDSFLTGTIGISVSF